MPSDQHLQWFDVDDFTPGLWESTGVRNEFAAPPNAFVTLTDYQPMKGGGIRAFFLATAVGTSGVVAPTTEECSGIYASQKQTRPGKTGGGTESFDALMVTHSSVDLKHRIYRMDQANDEVVWKLVNASAAGTDTAYRCTCFEQFQRATGVDTVVYVLSINHGDRGLWTVGYAYGAAGAAPDNVATKLQTWDGPLAISQGRILVGGHLDARIHYSDVGATSYTNPTQYLDVHRSRSDADLSIISAIAPDDLLIGKTGAPWVEINGDVSVASTPVREMGAEHVTHRHRQQAPRVPGGIAFIEGNGRVFVTDGRTFRSISDQIKRIDANPGGGLLGNGQLAFNNDFLFVPGGYVYDFVTNSWFKQSSLATSQFHWRNESEVWLASPGSSFDVKRMGLFRSAGSTRASTGVIQTVPYADKTGRNVDIREVQLFVNTYAASEIKVELIDQTDAISVTRYATVTTAKKELVKFLFPYTKSEYLSVRITPRSIDGTSEAPTIERLRIGFGPNNLVT